MFGTAKWPVYHAKLNNTLGRLSTNMRQSLELFGGRRIDIDRIPFHYGGNLALINHPRRTGERTDRKKYHYRDRRYSHIQNSWPPQVRGRSIAVSPEEPAMQAGMLTLQSPRSLLTAYRLLLTSHSLIPKRAFFDILQVFVCFLQNGTGAG